MNVILEALFWTKMETKIYRFLSCSVFCLFCLMKCSTAVYQESYFVVHNTSSFFFLMHMLLWIDVWHSSIIYISIIWFKVFYVKHLSQFCDDRGKLHEMCGLHRSVRRNVTKCWWLSCLRLGSLRLSAWHVPKFGECGSSQSMLWSLHLHHICKWQPTSTLPVHWMC